MENSCLSVCVTLKGVGTMLMDQPLVEATRNSLVDSLLDRVKSLEKEYHSLDAAPVNSSVQDRVRHAAKALDDHAEVGACTK